VSPAAARVKNFGGGTPSEFSRARDILYQHCADARRDQAEILLSAQVPFGTDAAQTAAAAAALGAAGAELAIIYLRPPYAATVLEPSARTLSGL
jgi:hypothetical protein